MTNSLLNYRSDDRHYHNFLHIGFMLDNLKTNFPYYAYNSIIMDAIVYHDVIYDPRRSDNEFKSAVFAQEDIRRIRGWDDCDGMRADYIDEVARLIMLTKNHIPQSDDDEIGKTIIDLDLAGMATSQYDNNTIRIRKEYRFADAETWAKGRIKFLTTYLDRPQIFHTEHGLKNWELPARENMLRELKTLEG